jgi:hypothetical protein
MKATPCGWLSCFSQAINCLSLQSIFLLKKQIIISIFLLAFSYSTGFSQQAAFSIATDLGLQRSIKKEQQYWAVGQTVHVHFHFTPKEGAYVWISYYSEGKFHNDLSATAKQPATNPQQINYVNNAAMRFKHLSVGWKHYFIGSSDIEKGWSLYGYTGFGLMLGRVINTYSVSIDTTLYNVQVRSGKANFKRLTLDLGLGWETPLGGDVYFYTEGRAWIPTTDYPSKYIFVNKNAPFVASLNFGVRILFD